MENLDYKVKFENIFDFFPTRFFSYLNKIEEQIGNIDEIELPKKVKKRADLISLYQGSFYGGILTGLSLIRF